MKLSGYFSLRRIVLFSICLSFVIGSCRQGYEELPYTVTPQVKEDSAMVVTAHPLASDVGVEILKKGGNAVDAAIAVQFALAVVYPRAGNIGGGGFMIVRLKNGESAALDYREKAPLAAHRDMYLDKKGEVDPELSLYGHLAVGVPGMVDGMVKAHQKYGNLSWPELLEPAIRLANEGVPITETEAERLNQYMQDFKKYSTKESVFTKRKKWQKGDVLVQKDLATTLELIRDTGRAGFYGGTVARKIIGEMERGNGIITQEDLDEYEAVWRIPVTGHFKNYKIIAMPPSSSGGVALLQLLKLTEPYADSLLFQSAETMQMMVEAMRRVYADRAIHLGDMDFYNVPVDSLLSDSYLKSRMSDYIPGKATDSDSIGAGNFNVHLESFETTHTSIIDPLGNAVSVTTTLNSNYGSKVCVGAAGFFLNNEMDDFSAKPGVPNQFGLVGAEANSIQPQKRMLSAMTPTIVEKDGSLFMVLGSPGGSTIITAVYQVIMNVANFDLTLRDAVDAGRFHHQWLPDEIWVEKDRFSLQKLDSLVQMGYTITEKERIAKVKAIMVLPDGTLYGVGDPRLGEDDAEGF